MNPELCEPKETRYSWLPLKNNEKSLGKQCENNPRWLGDNVGYVGIHNWVKRRIGIARKCSECDKKANGHSLHLANISGEYKRDLSDWKWLCSKCHAIFDKKSEQKMGSKNPNWKGGVSAVEKICPICEKVFITDHKNITCSKSCAGKMRWRNNPWRLPKCFSR